MRRAYRTCCGAPTAAAYNEKSVSTKRLLRYHLAAVMGFIPCNRGELINDRSVWSLTGVLKNRPFRYDVQLNCQIGQELTDFQDQSNMTESSQKSILSYYENRQCSTQWRSFLGVLAEEFEGQLGVPELRELMRRIGERFARTAVLGACETVRDLEAAINSVWAARDWGWVQVFDGDDYLAIRHYCSPLRTAFGEASASWASGYLEGVYQQWFNALGVNASLQLRVREALQADADGALEFRLAR